MIIHLLCVSICVCLLLKPLHVAQFEIKTYSFLQALLAEKGFFDRYDRDGEQIYDMHMRGYCKEFKPPYLTNIENDWYQTKDWKYSDESTISYSGTGARYNMPSLLNFWKAARNWSEYSLIKKNYLCKNSKISAFVKLGTGIIFRTRGTYDFWGALRSKSNVNLVKVEYGAYTILKTIDCSVYDWTLLKISERIGDVFVVCGNGTNLSKARYKLENINDISDEHAQTAGLISFDGTAIFKNVTLGNVNWAPKTVDVNLPKFKKNNKKMESKKSKIDKIENLSKYYNDLTQWCPEYSYCGPSLYKPYFKKNENI